MRPWKEIDAIMIVGILNGGARQLNLWKLFDRCCHGGRSNLPVRSQPLIPTGGEG